MYPERLHHLIIIMQRVIEHDKQFDMSRWMAPGATLCGSMCCALGWAASDPQCIAEGLHIMAYWRDDSDPPEPIRVELTTPAAWAQIPDLRTQSVDFIPYFAGASGFDAATAYYDITYPQAEYLFNPYSYTDNDDAHDAITVIDVIAHIRAVLDGYEPDALVYPEDDEDGR